MSDLIVKVCNVDKIEKHPNADRLSIVTIKGWNCIVGLNQYKEGDLVIFCPPDSIIPIDIIEKYKLEYMGKNRRVKTVKLRKAISQGLILDIPEGKKWAEGKDVAKELGITKYEPPVSTRLQVAGQPSKRKLNPSFDKYTDINNIKHYNNLFKIGEEVVITEKIHGTNFRAGNLKRYNKGIWNKIKCFLFGKYEFVYGSHNVQIIGHKGRNCFYGEDVYGRMGAKYKLGEIIPKDFIFYGEIHGGNIQDLNYDLKDIDLRIFDIKYKGEYLDWNVVELVCATMELKTVPVLYQGILEEGMIEQFTRGLSTIANHIREGCVIKPSIEDNTIVIGRKILKSINSEYLVRENRTEDH